MPSGEGKLRILMVNAPADPTAGGAEKHVFELADQLRAQGHHVSFLHAFPYRGMAADPETTVLHRTDWREDQVRRFRNHAGDFVCNPSPRVERAVAAHRPDVVHTHNLPGITTAVWESCRRLGIPVVHTLHDYYLFCARRSLADGDAEPCRPSPLVCGLRARRLARWSGAVSEVVGVSRFILDAHAGRFPEARSHLIRHPVVPSAMRPLGPPGPSLRRLGYIGHLHAIKGIRVLIAAAPSLARHGVAVAIAGKGRRRLQDEVVAAAAREPNVSFEGYLEGAEKERFFESCDAGIVPSVWDEPGGPPYTALEWLCAGRPALVSTRGGLAETLDSFGGAIRIEPSVDGIVAAVDRLLDARRWREAVEAVEPVVAHGDEERWVGEYERVYEAAVRRAAVPAAAADGAGG